MYFSTVVWLRKNQHFFRQINVYTKEFTKELISRKFLSVIAFFSTFPHCEELIWRNICKNKIMWEKLQNISISIYSTFFGSMQTVCNNCKTFHSTFHLTHFNLFSFSSVCCHVSQNWCMLDLYITMRLVD